jgi:hypothetical protein
MGYIVVMINGRYIQFEADRVQEYGDDYTFYLDGDVVAEFNKKNIAGYIQVEDEEEEE